MHSIATMAERLRADGDAVGLCTANGGFVTKHAFGVYSDPSARRRRSATATCRPRSTRSPAASSPRTTTAPVTVETSTVMHDRDGNPEQAWLATPARRRPPGLGAPAPTPT